jgi:hypothetical protein
MMVLPWKTVKAFDTFVDENVAQKLQLVDSAV